MQRNASESQVSPVQNYIVISISYCVLTLVDGSLRTIVLLHCATLGFMPLEIAFMFVLYEFMGILVNLFGGHLATRTGLRFTACLGLVLMSLSVALAAPVEIMFLHKPGVIDSNSSSNSTSNSSLQNNDMISYNVSQTRMHFMIYVFAVQGLAGVGKDLMKISGKSVTKLVNKKGNNGALFKTVARVTGYKNTVKGFGYFFGGAILVVGYWQGTCILASLALLPLPALLYYVDGNLAVSKRPPPLREIFQKIPYNIKILSAARFWLFGSRDVWFEIAAPIFLKKIVQWPDSAVSAIMGIYIIVYGQLQVLSRRVCLGPCGCNPPHSWHVVPWTTILGAICAVAGFAFWIIHGGSGKSLLVERISNNDSMHTAVSALMPIVFLLFAIVMAVLSAMHSYLVVLYAGRNKVAKDVGFYYMANAGGRLVGTMCSGILYQYSGDQWGIAICLWVAAVFLALAAVQSRFLSPHEEEKAQEMSGAELNCANPLELDMSEMKDLDNLKCSEGITL